MKLTPRETWLCALLPAALAALVLQFGHLRPLRREVLALRAQARAEGPLEARSALIRQAAAACDASEEEVRRRRAELDAPGGAGAEGFAFDRNRALQRVSEWSGQAGLTLLSSAPEPGGRLPDHLVQAGEAIARRAPEARPQVWRFELQGEYEGMLALLDTLRGNRAPGIVPVGVTLRSAPADGVPHTWILTLWL